MVYMAPELIEGNNKSYLSDYWAFGILLHLLYYKRYPFLKKTRAILFFNILNGRIQPETPSKRAPKDLKELIYGLLNLNPKYRLGWNP